MELYKLIDIKCIEVAVYLLLINPFRTDNYYENIRTFFRTRWLYQKHLFEICFDSATSSSELLENLEEMFPLYYMDIYNVGGGGPLKTPMEVLNINSSSTSNSV